MPGRKASQAISLALVLCTAALASAVRAQELGDPTARSQREPLEDSRRPDEPEIQAIPDEPPPPPALEAPVTVVAPPQPAARTPGVDRRERRANALPVPDEYLDPTFPVDPTATRIAPEQSDSVQEVPLDDQQLDTAEREEAERYKEALGHYKDPDEFTEDNWGEDPRDRTRSRDLDEYEDPPEW
jgi:hypothetical protein